MSKKISISSAKEILKRFWGYNEFRAKQEEVIQEVLNYRDLVALLPTAGGKSICYQVPALLADGLTIVVTPLISLMEDQVGRLKRLGIKAECIHSGMHFKSIDRVLDNCIFSDVKLLYVSPERLNNELFLTRAKKMKIHFCAIDEAHCISQWGHDFRPSYLKINQFIKEFEDIRIIALTATATERVIDEIVSHLHLKNPVIIKDSFLRKNIQIRIRKTENKIDEIKKLCRSSSDQVLIYVRSRRQVEMIAQILKNENYKASFYHAGLDYYQKARIQNDFSKGKIRIIAATNAFGMGIDIPNVRQVIHFGIPPSIEEYYQEIGRAGRDGRPSFADMIYNNADVEKLNEGFILDFPPFDEIVKLYKKIHVYYSIGIGDGRGKSMSYDLIKLARKLKKRVKELNGGLKVLRILGWVHLIEESKGRTLIKVLVGPREMRAYGNENEGVRPYIEAIMRQFEGVFDEWVEVDMIKLSKRLGLSNESLLELNQFFKQKQMIGFYEEVTGPRIQFLQDRLKSSDLKDYKKKYKRLRDLKKNRLVEMFKFLRNKECRYHFLLAYFNEEFQCSCMNCDVCLENPLQLSNNQIEGLDNSGLKTLLDIASREKSKNLLERLEQLHNEGRIDLPISR